jgi:hypothetical protein
VLGKLSSGMQEIYVAKNNDFPFNRQKVCNNITLQT